MPEIESMKAYFQTYLEDLCDAFSNIDHDALNEVVREMTRAWREGRNVFIMGNGGSAAMASHMTNDINKLTIVPTQRRFRAVSLTDNVPLITAWANDSDYERVFAEQLQGLCRPDDVLIAFSCSGNSRNILAGLRLGSELGAHTIGFTGDRGGELAQMVDVCVFAPIEPIYQQEDLHMILSHMLATGLKKRIAEISERRAQPHQSLILAAGEGTRLRPHTLDRPKPMLPIEGRPLVEYTIDWLKRYGLSDIAMNLSYLPEVVTDYFGDGSAFGIRLVYSLEDPIRGTAGALRQLGHHLTGAPLVVVYGDVLTDFDLESLLTFHHENVLRDPETAITMSLYRVPNPTEVGLVDLDGQGRIRRFIEKPRPEQVFTDLAAAGVLVLEPWVVEQIPTDGFYDFGLDLFPALLASGKSLYGWIVPDDAYLLDIGSPAKYEQAQREWPLRSRRAQQRSAAGARVPVSAEA